MRCNLRVCPSLLHCSYCQTPGNCTSADGHFPYGFPEQDKCFMPVGGPIWCMTENMADATYRGYNVPHSTAVWLGMYRVARFYDKLTTAQPWTWYLERGFRLAFRLGSPDVGLMDGTWPLSSCLPAISFR